MVGIYDAESTNASERIAQKHVDLDLFFSKKNSTKDVNTITNVTAIKRSVRNLILTNPFERAFHPEIGSGVRDILFEPMTPITTTILNQKIEDVIPSPITSNFIIRLYEFKKNN